MNTTQPQISVPQLNVMRHAIGYGDDGSDRFPGARSLDERRNRYITSAESAEGQLCLALCSLGYMHDYGPQRLARGDHYFEVTDAGRAVVLAANAEARDKREAGLTDRQRRAKARYQEFLNADCFESFWHFLKYKSRKQRSY